MFFLSVIIPAYNAVNSIVNCVNSIPDNTEIIIIDDGSVDGTKELLDNLLCSNPNLTVFYQANAGVSAARNKGLEIASGEYVAFLDSDDTLDSEKMRKCIELIEQNPDIDMLVYGISFDYYHKNNCFRSTAMMPPYEGIKTIEECVNDINSLFDTNSLSSLCTRIIKKSIIINMFLREDMFMYEDLEFSLRVLTCCETVCFCRDIVYHYRHIENHASKRIRKLYDIRDITNKIDEALSPLNCEKEHIISTLSRILLSQKIDSYTYSELKKIYPDKAVKMMCKRIYGYVRHFVADSIKFHIWRLKSKQMIGNKTRHDKRTIN